LAHLSEVLVEAASVVGRVASGRSLAPHFDAEGRLDRSGRAALVELVYATLRRYGRVQAIVRLLSKRGRTDRLLEPLLWCALAALDCGRYSPHTLVEQAVEAARKAGREHAAGYVNALLRAWLRGRALFETALAADPVAFYWHPAWWIDRVRAAHPEHWQEILAAGNTRPPMALRVNRRRASPEQVLARLAQAGIGARRLEGMAIVLDRPLPVAHLPGYAEGVVSVQDAGAQRAISILDLRDGQRVLDACAAPGGKSGHILECADVSLLALEADAARCDALRRNLARLGLSAEVRAADCTAVAQWWDGRPFERILADVPCTGSGVVRRHPDAKWLRRASDAAGFARRQREILDALWPLLAPGGKLLYVTCSVFPEENEEQVRDFLARTPQARRLALPDGTPSQLLPDAEHDGFFFALIGKAT